MSIASHDAEGRILVAHVAVRSLLQVQAEILREEAGIGRSGIYWRLRAKARELSTSPAPCDQIAALAYAHAAEDLAWGRAPLAEWRLFTDSSRTPDPRARARLRSELPVAGPETSRDARRLVADLERRVLQDKDGPQGVLEAGQMLGQAAVLQHLLWDDPRIEAAVPVRLVMRESIDLIRERAAFFRCGNPAQPGAPGIRRSFSARLMRSWRLATDRRTGSAE